MHKKVIKFIHDLKVLFLSLIVIAFLFQLGVTPLDVSSFVGAKIGQAVNIQSSAGVKSNPINTLALELKEKENKLIQQEGELKTRENRLDNTILSQKNLLIFIAAGIMILLILILVNFYFDFRNRHNQKEEM